MRRTVCVVVVAAAVVVALAGCRAAGKVTMEDALRWDNPIRYVTSSDIRGITKGMTYGAIIGRLGPTRDVGSGDNPQRGPGVRTCHVLPLRCASPS